MRDPRRRPQRTSSEMGIGSAANANNSGQSARADPLFVRIAKQAQVALAALLENEIGERVPAAFSPSLCNARCLGGKGSLAALPSLIILVGPRTAMSDIRRSLLAGSARDILPHTQLHEKRRRTATQLGIAPPSS